MSSTNKVDRNKKTYKKKGIANIPIAMKEELKINLFAVESSLSFICTNNVPQPPPLEQAIDNKHCLIDMKGQNADSKTTW